MDIWNYPYTWHVGDNLDAVTLNTRIRDQNNILLRRPLTVATMSAAQTWSSGNLSLGWDTIVQDDDGMVVGDASPTVFFYAQRAGSYRVWCTICINSVTTVQAVALTAFVNNSTTVFQNAYRMEARSGLPFMINVTGIVTMTPGESIKMFAWNGLGTTSLTVAGLNNNCPTIAMMWLGPT